MFFCHDAGKIPKKCLHPKKTVKINEKMLYIVDRFMYDTAFSFWSVIFTEAQV